MSEAIHLPCVDKQGCGSSDAYSWNNEKEQGYCHACELKTWMFKDKLWVKRSGQKKVTPLDNQEDHVLEDTQDFVPKDIKEPITGGTFVGMRGITSGTMEKFGVKTNGDKQHYVYPSGGTKTRHIKNKDFSTPKGFKADELFGMNLFPVGGSKIVTITEGELDAMSAWQMLSAGSAYSNPVVSLPSANPTGKLWEKVKNWLDSFEKIIFSADNDKPGKEMAERMSLMFPSKVYIMDHGQFKDANDFLQAGKGKDFKNAWWSAKKYRPDDVLMDAEDYLALYEESPDFEYFETGVPELDSKILGICKGYFTVIQAPTGVGKTEVMRYLEYQCLTTSDYKFAYMHLEESRIRSVLGLVSYKLNDNLTIQKFIEEKGRDEDVKGAIVDLTSSGRMIQFRYSPEDGYEVLLDKIKYYVAAYGVDYVFFEPIQDLVTGQDKEAKLADLSSRLGTMASELGVGIVTIAHQNQNGDTMYATMIGKKAAFEIVLSRDQETEDLTEKNRTYISVGRKNRVGLGNGPAGSFKFEHSSYTLKPWAGPREPKTENKGDF
jgi:KaiC/GvpD/RAD55 family RecA-like ATPase